MTWWNIIQALAWISTADEFVVDFVRADVSISSADIRASLKAGYGQSPRNTGLWKAREALREACASGAMHIRGQLRNKGDPKDIPVEAWSHLIVHDVEGQRPIRAAPATEQGASSWWTDLRLRSDDVRRHWPAKVEIAEAFGWDLQTSNSSHAAPMAVPSQTLRAAITDAPLKLEDAKAWLVVELGRRKISGERRLQSDMVLALRAEFPSIGERTARNLFRDAPMDLKTGRGRKRGSGNSRQI